MAVVQMIFFTLIVLGVLVTFHEFGHFWVARRCGVKVIRFSIGFGTPLLRWQDAKGTEFVIALLPLGGYVKMVDEREGNVSDEDIPYAFNRKSVLQRIAIVGAGPAANFILAIVVYWFVFLYGVQGVAPIVAGVVEGSIAEEAGLIPGQEVVAVDGVPTPTWQALGERLVYRLGDKDQIRFTLLDTDTQLEYQYEAMLGDWAVDTKAPDPIKSMGIELFQPRVAPIAALITPDGPADQAGMLSGDEVLSADGEAIHDWRAWVMYVRARPNQNIAVLLQRDGQVFELNISPRSVEENGEIIGQVGMSVAQPVWPEGFIRETRYGIIAGFSKACSQVLGTSEMILKSIGKMVTGALSVEHLSGPITIAKVAGSSAEYGLVPFLQFMALLSVSLGVLNLLPIPVLDGGHLIYYFVEAIKGSPVSSRFQVAGQQLGMLFIIGLMALALYNDLQRL